MLCHSFTHIPGIGPSHERALWERGAISWEHLLAMDARSLPRYVDDRFRQELRSSQAALECLDGCYFERCLPAADMWRSYPDFKDKTVFLDIETTGLAPETSEVTVVSMFDQSGARALVKGRDLDQFPEAIAGYSLLVTYNGKCFDLPFLHAHFPRFKKNYAHIDLRYPLAKLGLRGGLKGIERQVGIERQGTLSQVDGFMAVLLWQEHMRGSKTALDTLVRYALEDVLNLKPLMEMVYNLNIKNLPLPVQPLAAENLPGIDIPCDETLIQRLKNRFVQGRS